jgi:hypothetical protein
MVTITTDCEIGDDTVKSLLGAKSIEQYYFVSIEGKFDCRPHHIPGYEP